jgi:D-arginine dehydrogenase
MIHCDVTIIGAGVLGLSTAYHLQEAGISFSLLDREDEPAMHTSGSAAGMIRHLYRHPQLTSWAKRSVEGWPERIQNEVFQRLGSLIVGRSVPPHHPELFTESEFQGRSAVYTERDGLIIPKKLCSVLFEHLPSSSFFANQRVKRIVHGADGWCVESATEERFCSKTVVNCAGAWINEFLPPEAQVAADSFVRHLAEVKNLPDFESGYVWDEELEWYARSWTEGQKLVSICDRASAHPDTFLSDPTIPVRTVVKLEQVFLQHHTELSKEHAAFEVGQCWSCFRTYSPDKLPLWGRDPILPGLYWLGAFGGFGMSTSFAASQDLVELIASPTRTTPAHFLDHRFVEEFSPRRTSGAVAQ